MRPGQKVKLKKYKDYSKTLTQRKYRYALDMQKLANYGQTLTYMEVTKYDRAGVILKDPDGLYWTFDKSDVICEINLENK